jgi:Flp pilus assembly protein TadG
MCNANNAKNDRGQTLLLYALMLSVLVLFAGLAIDAGRLYVTKAKLATAVDGACLTGMKNLAKGQTTAGALATDMFYANYGANPPTPAVTFPTDIYGDQQVKVTATANVNTYFMQLLPVFATVPVSDTAVSTRGKLIMTIVLDRSGSMANNGGGVALQSAVPTFVNMFNDLTDNIAMVSFSSNSTINFPIGPNFQSSINTQVANMEFVGGTFGTGVGSGAVLSHTEGPPMALADAQNTSVPIEPGENVIKVLVYFTDGLMNASQDNFHCGGTTNNNLTLINYGGYDTGGNYVGFFDPTCTPSTPASNNGCLNEVGHESEWGYCDGSAGCPNGFPYDANGDICKNAEGQAVTTFLSQQTGLQTTFIRTNVTAETQWRAIQTANAMRTESPIPTYIYTIGLGNLVSPSTQAFLAQLANDPSYSTYISGQPAGLFQYVPDCPSSACTAELNTVFQTIAARVLLRLTQ